MRAQFEFNSQFKQDVNPGISPILTWLIQVIIITISFHERIILIFQMHNIFEKHVRESRFKSLFSSSPVLIIAMQF